MKGNRNIDNICKIVILLSLTGLLLYELISGKIYYYVHPRYLPGLWLSVVVLLVFAISLLWEKKKGRHNSSVSQYGLYAVPIVLALLFPVIQGGNGNIAIAQSSIGRDSNNSIDAGQELSEEKDISSDTDVTLTDPNDTEEGTDSFGNTEIPEPVEPEDKSQKYAVKSENGAILISNEEYAAWYYDLYDYLDDFKGKRYQFTAQVFPLEGLKANQFLAGRYIMTCCAVDLTGYGLISESDLADGLKENEWLTVTGTIGEYEYNGMKVPYLTDIEMEKAAAPKEEYVYYYYY
ncbi:TIGR03943 family protein [Anaerocolumna sp. AGMB13020]|uniref:TIGR03943 family putative permease subunit n=1 Tax=Anaerocolumna sp. AGMB13020 TaxID=3081750 RepID=UPI00295578E9|nr:TIGR03943 family protein [Anaerocolumna sp. AGMB13020]WOO35656.1 TIGR03943 family protein [Anaerocolumna sp. AGMB13020]